MLGRFCFGHNSLWVERGFFGASGEQYGCVFLGGLLALVMYKCRVSGSELIEAG